jgi:hypothetical protein
VDVEGVEVDPVLAEELPGRGARGSGPLREERDAFHFRDDRTIVRRRPPSTR